MYQDLIGPIRRFGNWGPLYQVLAVQGDQALLEFVESGEQITILVTAILTDPEVL